MEWNFLFRIDYLNETGEERNLKGTLFTDGEHPPAQDDIIGFLRQSGYEVGVADVDRMIFRGTGVRGPIEIRIVKLGRGKEEHDDAFVRALAEQFRKQDPAIG